MALGEVLNDFLVLRPRSDHTNSDELEHLHLHFFDGDFGVKLTTVGELKVHIRLIHIIGHEYGIEKVAAEPDVERLHFRVPV